MEIRLACPLLSGFFGDGVLRLVLELAVAGSCFEEQGSFSRVQPGCVGDCFYVWAWAGFGQVLAVVAGDF